MVKMVHFMLCIFDHSKINQTSLSIAKSPDSVTSLDTVPPFLQALPMMFLLSRKCHFANLLPTLP